MQRHALWSVICVCVLFSQSAFSAYNAGFSLSWSQYQKLENEFRTAWLSGKPLENLSRLNSALARELTPAMLDVLAQPDRVFLGMFTDPEERKTGDYSQKNLDEGSGIRVIFQKEVPAAIPILTRPEPRLVSLIFFVNYNFDKKDIEFISGPDAFRVRSEAAPFEKGRHGMGFVGSSFSMEINEKGEVVSFQPGVYLKEDGEYKYHNIGIPAGPEHCSVCHDKKTMFSERYMQRPPEETHGFKKFISYVKEKGASDEEITQLETRLKNPKSLLPPGMLQLIQQRLKR